MVSLEEYMAFYEEACPSSPDDDACSRFTLPKLHQIIHMHGFAKLYNRPKRELLDALESVDLMPPARSTLLRWGGVSPGGHPTREELAADLAALGWAECPLRAVRVLDPVAKMEFHKEGSPPPSSPSPTPPSPPSPVRRVRRRRSCPATFVLGGRRPRTKRKRASINALSAAGGYLPSQAPSPDLPSPASLPPPTPSPPSLTPPPIQPPCPSQPCSPYPPPPPTVPPPSPLPPPLPPLPPPLGFQCHLRHATPPLLLRPPDFPPATPRSALPPPPLRGISPPPSP